MQGNDLDLGASANVAGKAHLSREARGRHLYVCGSTGTGKSKFLEHLVREDIKKWHESRCGMIVIDPHGSLYNSVISWLAWNEDVFKDLPIIPIDLRRDDWIVSYNMLRERSSADPAAVVGNFVQAMAHVWGESGTNRTPLFAKWAHHVLSVLYEKKLTLAEAPFLLSRTNRDRRRAIVEGTTNELAREDFDLLDTLSPSQIDERIGSTINRFHRFLSTQSMRHIFGQQHVSLDMRKALDEGQIILVNLSTEGSKVHKEDVSVFATLLINDLWNAGEERGKKTDESLVRPFYVYIDEFQNFITPTIAESLDQARGYGLHMTLAHQFPNQLLHEGAHGHQVYDSVMVNAKSKVVFQMAGEENLRPLALDLFMGTMSPDRIKKELYATKVMGYVETSRTSYGETRTEATGDTSNSGMAWGEGMGGSRMLPASSSVRVSRSISDSHFRSNSESEAYARSEAVSRSESIVPVQLPILGKELSSVQFDPIEDQIFRAMAALHDQQQRECVVKITGLNRPLHLLTPEVMKSASSDERIERYTEMLFSNCPCALRMDEAKEKLKQRQALLSKKPNEVADEPITTRKRVG